MFRPPPARACSVGGACAGTNSRIERVAEDIQMHKAKVDGDKYHAAAVDTSTYNRSRFMARFARFENISALAADHTKASKAAGS